MKDEPLNVDEFLATLRDAAQYQDFKRIYVTGFYEDGRRCGMTLAELLAECVGWFEAMQKAGGEMYEEADRARKEAARLQDALTFYERGLSWTTRTAHEIANGTTELSEPTRRNGSGLTRQPDASAR